MEMKRTKLKKYRLGRWYAFSAGKGAIWHIYHNKKHYGRLVKGRIEFSGRGISVKKIYYLYRFLGKLWNKIK